MIMSPPTATAGGSAAPCHGNQIQARAEHGRTVAFVSFLSSLISRQEQRKAAAGFCAIRKRRGSKSSRFVASRHVRPRWPRRTRKKLAVNGLLLVALSLLIAALASPEGF